MTREQVRNRVQNSLLLCQDGSKVYFRFAPVEDDLFRFGLSIHYAFSRDKESVESARQHLVDYLTDSIFAITKP